MTLGLLGAITNRAVLDVVVGATLVRDVNGLIFRDDFNRANEQLAASPFWIRTDGIGIDQIVSNQVVPGSPYGDAQVSGSITVPSSAILQYNQDLGTGGAAAGDIWIRNALNPNMNNEGVRISGNVGLNVQELAIFSGGVKQASNTQSPGNVGSPNTIRVVVEDLGASGIRARSYRAIIGALTDVTSSLALFNSEISVTQANEPAESDILRATHGPTVNLFDEFISFGRNLVISSVSAGFKGRVIGSDVTGSLVTESGGTVTIDIDAVAMPASRVEITDASDVVQASFDVASGVWGGDQYTFSPA